LKTNAVDISVVVTAHHEGLLAHRSMRSLFVAVEYATTRGLTTEIVVVLDKPDTATAEYFATTGRGEFRLETVAFGDPGLSRNHGVKVSAGRYVAFLDADNLFSEFWLYKAYRCLEKTATPVVVHPEYYVIFEMENRIWRQISSLDPQFSPLTLLETNCWDTVCMARREVFLDNPFYVTTHGHGFGYEDWHFNCETLVNGIEHGVVPETSYFIRRKSQGSQLLESNRDNRVLGPSKLFDPITFASFIQSRQELNRHREEPAIRLSVKAKVMGRLYRHRRKLKKPVDLALKVISRLNHHCEPLSRGLVESVKSILSPTEPVPPWLLNEWSAINTIEPQLFPERRLVSRIAHYAVSAPRIGGHYLELCRLFADETSHLIVLPWLKRGGADLAALTYIEALAANPRVRGITVIATNNTDSPWSHRIPTRVRFIEFGRLCHDLTNDEQEKLLTRLLLQMAPSVVHNINSDLGYRVICKYGVALQTVSRLYASSYCDDITPEGKIAGYPSKYLPQCIDVLNGILCDCRYFADKLHERYAFDKAKLFVHYLPSPVADMRKYPVGLKRKKHLDILWASRLDRQKRPDLLVEIARACRDLPVTFHVYGSPLLEADRITPLFRKLVNVTYYGQFDGLHSLSVETYDVFLYTAQWDGLPNILLEAMATGLPVIAPNVCGIGEVVIDHETGFLVDRFDDVDGYVRCVKEILHDSRKLSGLVEKAQALLGERHSRASFVEVLKQLPGYFPGPGPA